VPALNVFREEGEIPAAPTFPGQDGHRRPFFIALSDALLAITMAGYMIEDRTQVTKYKARSASEGKIRNRPG
jgi:hypothetical protein